jgi:glyoxylase-like metal-dependent hydrolase (beta-lactamase superfamily II)
MKRIHHLNCLKIVTPRHPNIIGHCLLLEHKGSLTLIDTGFGLLDNQKPIERLGQQLIDMVGFHSNENLTAIMQIKKLLLNPNDVSNCIITHLDPDHIGGLADFPKATVHVSLEEYENFKSGNQRYLPIQLDHNPTIKTYSKSTDSWFGFEARKVIINGLDEIFFIQLFGHTLGHCGVAIKQNSNWLFYVGDAYYFRAELTDSNHPVNELPKIRADNNELRIETLDKIRKLVNENPEIEVFGFHDIEEFKHFKTR